MPSLVEGLYDTLRELLLACGVTRPALDDDWSPATSHNEHDDQLGHRHFPPAWAILYFFIDMGQCVGSGSPHELSKTVGVDGPTASRARIGAVSNQDRSRP